MRNIISVYVFYEQVAPKLVIKKGTVDGALLVIILFLPALRERIRE